MKGFIEISYEEGTLINVSYIQVIENYGEKIRIYVFNDTGSTLYYDVAETYEGIKAKIKEALE